MGGPGERERTKAGLQQYVAQPWSKQKTEARQGNNGSAQSTAGRMVTNTTRGGGHQRPARTNNKRREPNKEAAKNNFTAEAYRVRREPTELQGKFKGYDRRVTTIDCMIATREGCKTSSTRKYASSGKQE